MKEYDFVALDVETANEDLSSICQIGFAYFKDGEIVNTFESYVNPETQFSEINISIHGITPEVVRDAIKLPELCDLLDKSLTNEIVAHHTLFDRTALNRCAENSHKKPLECHWLDSARVVRRTWPNVRKSGYSLANLSEMLNIPRDNPHDALDDAITAGKILIKAIDESQIPISEWLIKAYKKLSSDTAFRDLARSEPDPDGPLYGEVIVFTGALSIPRLEAAQMAYQLGCNVDTGVTRNTTILVVGDQDERKLSGYQKSSKHRKAEELITKGQHIRIIGEGDFSSLVNM